MLLKIVNSFNSTHYLGNPAAVTLVSEFPSEESMQKIAAKMNLSETAFVRQLSTNRYHIRWFTPSTEVKLCGHATLAAAYVLKKDHGIGDDKLIFESLSGDLNVSVSGDLISLNFPIDPVHPYDLSQKAKEALSNESNIINVAKGSKDDSFIVVEYENTESVKNLRPDFKALTAACSNAIIVTCKDSDDYDYACRVFAPQYGIDEDPVTGSAQTLLPDYWKKKLKKDRFHVRQLSERGGELWATHLSDRVMISGKATIERDVIIDAIL